MKLVGGYQDTRDNEEDLALTPYLFLVNVNHEGSTIFGLGFCWFYSAIFLAFGFNLPKSYKRFRIYNNKDE